MAKNITYRPNLHLDRNYDTDGYIRSQYEESINDAQYLKDSGYEEVKKEIEEMHLIADDLPDDMKDLINNMVSTLEFIFVQIDKDLVDNEQDDPDIVIKEDEDVDTDISEEEDDDDIPISSNVPNIIIDIKQHNVLKSINKRYCNILYEISKDYINDFRRATTRYYMDMGTLIAESDGDTGFISKKYVLKTEDIKSNELKHVSDYLIKSQIIRNQKQRISNKLFNEYESLNVIKACEASRELLIRYTVEEFRNNNSFIDLLSNMTLQESKLQYERKMEENLYELYKYLSSSVILLDECLRLYTKESQLKLMLIKEEGINL